MMQKLIVNKTDTHLRQLKSTLFYFSIRGPKDNIKTSLILVCSIHYKRAYGRSVFIKKNIKIGHTTVFIKTFFASNEWIPDSLKVTSESKKRLNKKVQNKLMEVEDKKESCSSNPLQLLNRFSIRMETYLLSRNLWNPGRKQARSVIQCIIRWLLCLSAVDNKNNVINCYTRLGDISSKYYFPHSIFRLLKYQPLYIYNTDIKE